MDPFLDVDLPLPDRRDGKVRVSYALPDDAGGPRRLFVTTDRLSAFDRIIAGVPYKGQVLNQLAAWWFGQTTDIVPNHVLSLPDPNALIARAATPLTVEVVVRGYITGVTSTSLWKQYADGARVIYGHPFPDGMRKNTALPYALVTPTTKGTGGLHDVPLTVAEVADQGLVPAKRWGEVVEAALLLFRRGQEVAAQAGLILADTKYEFGTAEDGSLLLIDEVHTPDSSRYWVADSYEARLAAGEEPESLDKEVVRRALLDAGYSGDGEPPLLPAEVWEAASRRYIDAFQRLTGTMFEPGAYPVPPRLKEALRDVL
ncbi:MAG: phosphoribosylaminoimidazolesuccinocarboxamide synthase [Acidimicrobiaceae bacterium]|nr:phosphoribosylaminoimidazolesuccinocarboxamide synthase [Ilumatobacter sp.]MCB9382572.1 phosphoribosylaminoimidazolesuccinocarboxamide synthase [Acidimicrobiaceae bacterium]MCO5329061.1 phosphoribosylaminoimidazolesuccinocarboxamide synthase [Ilumatobacteraceae bacterium]